MVARAVLRLVEGRKKRRNGLKTVLTYRLLPATKSSFTLRAVRLKLAESLLLFPKEACRSPIKIMTRREPIEGGIKEAAA